jgi:acyl-[acyl-carrier-protein]-phospholipid O-acyltransferase/long-chain-fatty-acid--[acyl-carrier-protein] ligase
MLGRRAANDRTGGNVLATCLRSVLQIVFRLRVRGGAAVRPGTLVIARHVSVLDPLILGLFLPGEPLVIASRDAARHPVAGRLLRAVRHIVLEGGHPLAVKQVVQHLRAGRTVVMFPEARVTVTGGIMKVYEAAGLIAARSAAPLVVARIDGLLESPFARVGRAWPRRSLPRVALTLEPQCHLPSPADGAGRERRRRLADAVLQRLQASCIGPSTDTLFDAFLNAVARHGRRTVIVEDVRGEPESYGDVLKSALALRRLAGRITREGEIVGVMMPTVTVALALVLGLTAGRRAPALLNYTAGPQALASAVCASGVRTVITARRFVALARLEGAVAALADCRIVYLEDLRASLGLADKVWILAALFAPRIAREPRATASDTALVLFTSGSEARPKGVALAHQAILANVAQMRAVIDFGPQDRYLNALPLYHTFGLIACSLLPLLTGTRLVLYTNPLHYRVIPELAYARDCTYVFGTSTFLAHYARHAHDYDFRSVRAVVCGGEKLNEAVADLWLRRFGLRILEGYGATECGPAMALNTPLAWRAGTVGRFLPGLEYRLVPVAGISDGAALHVRGPQLMKGCYFYEQPGDLQPPRSEVGAGWYSTGDIVAVDADGYVQIRGRVKRFAKIAGEMVSLEMVERVAYDASPVCKHAATVEALPGVGESTVLFTTDATLDRIGLREAARRLGARDLAVARRIIHVPELPLLGSGKTDYVTLRDEVLRSA